MVYYPLKLFSWTADLTRDALRWSDTIRECISALSELTVDYPLNEKMDFLAAGTICPSISSCMRKMIGKRNCWIRSWKYYCRLSSHYGYMLHPAIHFWSDLRASSINDSYYYIIIMLLYTCVLQVHYKFITCLFAIYTVAMQYIYIPMLFFYIYFWHFCLLLG